MMKKNKWKGRYIKVDNNMIHTILYIHKYIARSDRHIFLYATDLSNMIEDRWWLPIKPKDWKYITKEMAIAELL